MRKGVRAWLALTSLYVAVFPALLAFLIGPAALNSIEAGRWFVPGSTWLFYLLLAQAPLVLLADNALAPISRVVRPPIEGRIVKDGGWRIGWMKENAAVEPAWLGNSGLQLVAAVLESVAYTAVAFGIPDLEMPPSGGINPRKAFK